MSPEDYDHFVFDNWDAMTEYPWHNLVSEKQARMLAEHKELAILVKSTEK
jgi:23S rRNA G2445 N2-methylase RlmL